MTRWLLLGGTGTVGRELAVRLERRPGAAICIASRNNVMLSELGQRLSCDTVEIDITSSDADARALPAADVVVDLTYAGGRHPKVMAKRAARAVRLLADYLDLQLNARLVHTGTWSLIEGGAPVDAPAGRLDWTDAYRVSKSATELALARSWKPGRMRIVRLGNVLTPDSIWGIMLLRALRAGAVANPDMLSRRANLSTVDELLEESERGSAPDVALTSRAAGWTWGELLTAVARKPGVSEVAGAAAGGAAVPSGAAASGGRADGLSHALRTGVGRLVRRALWYAPERVEGLPVESAPRPLLPVVRRLLGHGAAMAEESLPPELPGFEAMAVAHRDEDELRAMANMLAVAYWERGYAPLEPRRLDAPG